MTQYTSVLCHLKLNVHAASFPVLQRRLPVGVAAGYASFRLLAGQKNPCMIRQVLGDTGHWFFRVAGQHDSFGCG